MARRRSGRCDPRIEVQDDVPIEHLVDVANLRHATYPRQNSPRPSLHFTSDTGRGTRRSEAGLISYSVEKYVSSASVSVCARPPGTLVVRRSSQPGSKPDSTIPLDDELTRGCCVRRDPLGERLIANLLDNAVRATRSPRTRGRSGLSIEIYLSKLPAHTVRNATVDGIRDARMARIRPADSKRYRDRD